ncbi:hypothetical protein D3C73_1459180 [compost metagenome]
MRFQNVVQALAHFGENAQNRVMADQTLHIVDDRPARTERADTDDRYIDHQNVLRRDGRFGDQEAGCVHQGRGREDRQRSEQHDQQEAPEVRRDVCG